jgi:DNA processing protein
LSGFIGLGPKRFKLLREYFGSVKDIWEAGESRLRQVGLKKEMIDRWVEWRRDKDLDKEMEELARREIKIVTIDDKEYPKLLKEIDTAPFVLFVKGSIKLLSQAGVTVVGTRQMSQYGRRAVERLVKGLVEARLVIVSGLARGIDGRAHRACLDGGGKTVAVLGHGLEKIYPPEYLSLAEEIVKAGGSLMSEYPLGYPISRGNFPARDRLMAGLSLGTLVIEGKQKSGTKITASWAAEYGREVWAVPGPIDSPVSQAAADLIQEGAKLVTKVEDVLEELNLPEA